MNREAADERAGLESLLRWYGAMGVDAAIDEVPHDRFGAPPSERVAPPVAEAQGRSSEAPKIAPAAAATSVEQMQREAEARAAVAADVAALREALEGLPGFTLGSAARMIWAGGRPGASVMVVCGAPDSDDERQGEVLAGPAGRLFDAMMRAIGLERQDLYIAPVVPWRPPGNRLPTAAELAVCLPFARRHIALARPHLILCLGERAAQPLLGTSEPISRLRGRWHSYEGESETRKLLVTFSLPYLLAQPLQKKRAWADLQMLAAEVAKKEP